MFFIIITQYGLSGMFCDCSKNTFFETRPMPTTESQNPTITCSVDPDSTQLSHPSRFCHWCPLFGDNGYPPFKSTTQNQDFFPQRDIISYKPRLKKIIYVHKQYDLVTVAPFYFLAVHSLYMSTYSQDNTQFIYLI